jgi:hypothetical protein
MSNIWIAIDQTVQPDSGRGYGGEPTPPYETFTDNRKRLFIALQREFGPCRSSVYRDKADGGAERIGWLFSKRCKYEDSNECYTLDTWVTLVTPETHPVQVTVKRHLPLNLDN